MKLFKSIKAQLGIIEMKYFIIGLILGVIVGIVLIYLGNHGTIPLNMKFVCPLPVK
jgi:small basic protein